MELAEIRHDLTGNGDLQLVLPKSIPLKQLQISIGGQVPNRLLRGSSFAAKCLLLFTQSKL